MKFKQVPFAFRQVILETVCSLLRITFGKSPSARSISKNWNGSIRRDIGSNVLLEFEDPAPAEISRIRYRRGLKGFLITAAIIATWSGTTFVTLRCASPTTILATCSNPDSVLFLVEVTNRRKNCLWRPALSTPAWGRAWANEALLWKFQTYLTKYREGWLIPRAGHFGGIP